MQLYLASASPRRLDLLREAGFDPLPVAQDFVERRSPGEQPRDLVVRLAEGKARSALVLLQPAREPGVLLAADTEVVLEGEVLGKPDDEAHAERMLRRLRARTHEVMTGVFLLRTDDGRFASGVDSTRVHFRDYDDETLRAYVASGEPLDKAGAYGIQGRGAVLSRGIEGSRSNVVGLPLERLDGWFARVGIEAAELKPA